MKGTKIFAIVFLVLAMVPTICLAELDSSWWANGGDSYVDYDNSIIVIPNLPEAENPYDVSWGKDNVSVQDDSFVLSFDSAGVVKLGVRVYKNSPPWTQYCVSQAEEFSAGLVQIELSCQGDSSGENAVVVVDLGYSENIGKTLIFSDISFVSVPVTTTTTTTVPVTTTTTSTTTTTTTTTTIPGQIPSVTNISYTDLGDGDISLAWSHPSSGDIEGYKIYLDGESVETTLETTYAINIGMGETKVISVTAYVSQLGGSDKESESLSIEVTSDDLFKPTELKAKITGGEYLKVSFAGENGVNYYMLQFNQGEPVNIGKLQQKVYQLPQGWIGPYEVSVWAVYNDESNSSSKATVLATVEAITELFIFRDGDQVEIRWGALAETEVKATIEGQEYELSDDQNPVQFSVQANSQVTISSFLKEVLGEPIVVTLGDQPVKAFWKVSKGWNLVSSPIQGDVLSVLKFQTGLSSVWKWKGNKWAVYLPEADEGTAYAASKGFDVLSTIKANQGFWVNGEKVISFEIEGQFPLFAEAPGPGWSIIGSGNDVVLSSQLGEFISSWVWRNENWSVYLSDEDVQAYAQAKGFAVLEVIYPGEGFWVNK